MSSIQITNILLWQKNGTLRNLEFLENHVNVITGDSGKGKSSILYIIDYCLLASETKGISKANIDSKVTWYGLKLKIHGRNLLIARPSEANKKASQAYLFEGEEIPETPFLNIKIDNLKKILNDAFGIDSELKIPYGGRHIRTGSKVSFRSFLPHSYQDQNAIIAPEYLYIRPADERYQESIERTFRMALGVENVKTSTAKTKLLDLEQQRLALERKKEIFEKNKLAFSDELQSLGQEAATLGILDSVPTDVDSLLQKLKEIVIDSEIPPPSKSEADLIEKQLFSLRAKNKKYEAFTDRKSEFTISAKQAEDALRPIEFFNKHPNLVFPSEMANSLIHHLQRELSILRASLKSKKQAPFLAEVTELISENTKEITKLEKELETLQKNQKARSSPKEYYKYIGRLDTKIELFSGSDSHNFNYDPEEYQTKADQLKSVIEEDNLKVELAEQKLNEFINEKLTRLKLKGYDTTFTARFSERERLIHLFSEDLSFVERMPDIGSASNYLYLHLAYFLSIHEVAKRHKVSWMPSFMILDQPSTPYYSTEGEPNDDVVSLDAALIEMNSFVKKMDQEGGFQIILLEHIRESDWKKLKLDRFHLVDKELRGDYGLILD
ncbi:DUF3732 domain-containing protein [Pseudomonas chlororaphis subsp. aurantiaca]|uniref:DUF3732 domain-containing protein n=1 Tax=Pseudomonas chlororaphis TaxID=587753 RepID=UPI0027DBD3E8|nr:DUF3732 domain-containing protein [Pseudomonas chlororaphis]WMJ00733.1 DUF3732 domain-containing protein [Pseudomonas chlororaphis subsp. aurantiaca]